MSSVPIITVVDDDPGFRQALVRLLNAAGMDVRSYHSAEEFLASDDGASSDAFVLDINLPGLSGLELCDRIQEARAEAPVIFMTGFSTPGFESGATQRGAVTFLTKPFAARDLIDAINSKQRSQ